MNWEEESFLEKLGETHQFPESYTFKFIVKLKYQAKVEALLPEADIKCKPSSQNKYVSVTLTRIMKSDREVVEVYNQAYKIKGIITL